MPEESLLKFACREYQKHLKNPFVEYLLNIKKNQERVIFIGYLCEKSFYGAPLASSERPPQGIAFREELYGQF